jgi:chromosome segregation ATPase
MAQMQQMQQQGQMMQEELQKLQQENMQLKSGAAEGQMKIQAGVQESQLKIQAKQQETQASLELDQQVQAAKLQLEREAAMAKIQLDRDIAAANLELEKMRIDASADSEVDQAIATVKNMVAMHETNMGAMMKGEEGGIAHPETDTNSMMQMHSTFMEGIQQIVDRLQAKKTISMKSPSGGTYTATIQ